MGLRFVPSLAPAAQAARSLTSALPPGVVRLIPSAVPASVSARWFGVPCVSSGELISGCDTPGGYQPPRISGSLVRDWKPVYSLVGDALSGAEFAPFPSPMPPASGGRWAGPQPVSSSLVFA